VTERRAAFDEIRRRVVPAGVSEDELPDDEAGLMMALIASFFRPGTTRMTLHEAAREAAVEEDDAFRIWRSLGLPEPSTDSKVCSGVAIDLFRGVQQMRQLLGNEPTEQLLRLIGSAMSRVAEAGASAFRVKVASDAWDDDPTGIALLDANARVADLVAAVGPALDTVLRHHIIESSVRPSVLVGRARGEETQDLAVGFVDVVESSTLVNELSPDCWCDFPALRRHRHGLRHDAGGSDREVSR